MSKELDGSPGRGEHGSRRLNWEVWLKPLVILAAASVSLILALVFVDFYLVGRHSGMSLWNLLVAAQPADAQQMVNGLAEVDVALLGMVITVASIVVQLAATRYTPRITELYISDRTNILFLAYFVVSSVYCLWVTFSIRSGKSYYVPVVGVAILFLLLAVAILAMTPYFAYVFHILDPQNVVTRIRQQTLDRALSRQDKDVDQRKALMLDGVEQLADVALNTLENKDKIIASRSVDALRDLLLNYIPEKEALSREWFEVTGPLAQDPDFVAMTRAKLAEISEQGTWVEYKVFRQYQMVYNEALNRMRDLNYLIAIDTKQLGIRAMELSDRAVVQLVVKFFNTFVRSTLNARDVRTGYNIFNQYRQLAEELLDRGLFELVAEVAEYFKYYAQVAFAMKLSFVTETIAYDLCTLCELAHRRRAPCLESLVETLLEVDKEPEAEVQESSLRGVRKAQIKLATYFLLVGEERLAHMIFEDMREEKPERLRSIYAELKRIDTKDFWEIIDRGENFDYLEPRRKERLETFFSWFPFSVAGEDTSA